MFLFRNEPPVLLHFYFLGNYTARICVRMESVGSRRRQCAKRASAPRIVCPVSRVHFSGEFFLILCEFSLLVRFFCLFTRTTLAGRTKAPTSGRSGELHSGNGSFVDCSAADIAIRRDDDAAT